MSGDSGDSSSWAPYLDEGERVLWEGRPDGRLFLLRRVDAFLIPFSVLWGGFAFIWTIGAAFAGAPFFFVLWGDLFCLGGAYLIIGRFAHDARIRHHTRYAITNRRALIVRGAVGRALKEMPLAPGLEMELREGTPGWIRLGPASPTVGFRGWGVWTGEDGSFTLRGLAEPGEVYALLRSVLRGDR